jgi:hypothetical protein
MLDKEKGFTDGGRVLGEISETLWDIYHTQVGAHCCWFGSQRLGTHAYIEIHATSRDLCMHLADSGKRGTAQTCGQMRATVKDYTKFGRAKGFTDEGRVLGETSETLWDICRTQVSYL